jgi:hypothetical protein
MQERAPPLGLYYRLYIVPVTDYAQGNILPPDPGAPSSNSHRYVITFFAVLPYPRPSGLRTMLSWRLEACRLMPPHRQAARLRAPRSVGPSLA